MCDSMGVWGEGEGCYGVEVYDSMGVWREGEGCYGVEVYDSLGVWGEGEGCYGGEVYDSMGGCWESGRVAIPIICTAMSFSNCSSSLK